MHVIIKEQLVQLQNNHQIVTCNNRKAIRLKTQVATTISTITIITIIVIRLIYDRLVWVRVPAHVNLVLPLN